MKRRSKTGVSLLFALLIGIFFVSCSQKRSGAPRVLVFSKTAGFHHASIPDGIKALQKMGEEKGFLVDTTTDASWFTEDSLQQYAAVVFLNTTGDVLNAAQQADFERYIQAGGGFLGIHAATDTEYDWPWYGRLVGAYFASHPAQQEAVLHIHKDPNFPITDSLPDPWKRKDEWYNFKEPPQDVHVLVSIDESSYEGGENGENHPMVWYHEYDGGRSFYIELGHTSESYVEPNYLNLLWSGLEYAIGDNKVLNYSKATALRKPDDDRFSKEILAQALDEPTELTILPNLDILFTERKGGIKYYNAQDSSLKEVAHIPVYHKALHVKDVNVEMGLLGIHADPHYDQNHWVYIYYSPEDSSVDRLSRFKFEEGEFKLNTEQVILEVPTRREICCHTGGSIAFDADDNLYLSVGDNTTPFNEKDPKTGKTLDINVNSYAPIDDRPGFENHDDRRAAGNTNDLRGKILRIHVEKDGSYTIPEGNLFPEGTERTRPEIYVMGGRNLYRLSVDKHTGYIYWGDVGPDARHDSLETRGPKGYDEVNQAREAGNFGWPYFVGDNYPYVEYDFNTGKSGKPFDPDHVVNNSRNNTGLKELPPAQPAFIWYPYDASPEFPIVGEGGRTAMTGPVYYTGDFPREKRFPEYYNGKLFIYEWIRDWIMVVTMNKEGDLETIEPFMEGTKFNHIIDMETGPDGRIYILEYGDGWFSKNDNSSLSVISYNGGNRPPKAELSINQSSGVLPLEVEFSAAESSDPDGDLLKYKWDLGNGETKETDEPKLDYTYQTAGEYMATVTVSDGKGGEAKSKRVQVLAGNARPEVKVEVTDGNPVFYFPNKKVNYQVQIQDAEDGNSDQPDFDQSRAFVQADYREGLDKAGDQSHSDLSRFSALIAGKGLMESLDCQSCHKISGTSVGPSYKEVALKYDNQEGAHELLQDHIIHGTAGHWGDNAMPAHSDLSEADAGKIVDWILSLAGEDKERPSMPLKGSFTPASKFTLTPTGAVVLSASYVDKGAKDLPSLTGSSSLVLRSPMIAASTTKTSESVSDLEFNGVSLKLVGGQEGWLKLPSLNLIGVKAVEITYGLQEASPEGWNAELHLDKPDGKLVGESTIGKSAKSMQPATAIINLEKTSVDRENHDVYLVLQKIDSEDPDGIAVISVDLKPE